MFSNGKKPKTKTLRKNLSTNSYHNKSISKSSIKKESRKNISIHKKNEKEKSCTKNEEKTCQKVEEENKNNSIHSTLKDSDENMSLVVEEKIIHKSSSVSTISAGFEKTTSKIDVPFKDSTSEYNSQSELPVLTKSSATVNDVLSICSEIEEKVDFIDKSLQSQNVEHDDYSKSTYLTNTLITLDSILHEAKHLKDKPAVRLSESNKRTFKENEKKEGIDHIIKEQVSVDNGKRIIGSLVEKTHDISNNNLVS